MYTPPIDWLPMPLAVAWGAGCGLIAFVADATQVLPSGTPWWGALIVAATPSIIAYFASQNTHKVKALQDKVIDLDARHEADTRTIAGNQKAIDELKGDVARALGEIEGLKAALLTPATTPTPRRDGEPLT